MNDTLLSSDVQVSPGKTKTLHLVLSAIVIVGLLPLVFISLFNHAAYDDFANAAKVLRLGLWDYQVMLYHTITGRYSTSFLLGILNPLQYEQWVLGYKLLPIAVLLSLLGAMLFYIKTYFTRPSFATSLFIAGIIVIYFLQTAHNIATLVYWFTGMAVYLIPMIFLVLYFAFLNIHFRKGRSKAGLIMLFLLAAILVGTNEIVLLQVLLINFGILVYVFARNEKQDRMLFLFLFIWTLVFSVLSITAPGNFARGETTHGASMMNAANFVKSIFNSLFYTTAKFFSWVNNLGLILATLLVGFLAGKNYLALTLKNLMRLIIGAVVFIIVLSIQVFPVYFGTGDVLPRVWDSVYFNFVLVWFTAVLWLLPAKKVAIEDPTHGNWQKKIVFAVLFAVVSFLSITSNIHTAYIDLLARAPEYDRAQLQRYSLIEDSRKKGEKDVTVPALVKFKYQYPKTIFGADITVDPENKLNRVASTYFGLNSLKLEEEPQ